MGEKQHDWAAIQTEYITTETSQRKLCEKYGVSMATLSKVARRERWTEKKKKYAQSVVEKAVRKHANKKANELAKELAAADKISGVILESLDDKYQFNRWIVSEGCGEGASETSEKIFDKTDMRALKDAAATLKMIEGLKRSISGLLTIQERQAMDIAERRMQLDEKKADADTKDTSVTIKFASDELEEWSE